MAMPAERLSKKYGLAHPQMLGQQLVNGDLARIFADGAKDAEKLMKRNLLRAGVGGRVRAGQLKTATAGLGQLSSELWNDSAVGIRRDIYSAAQMAADQSINIDRLMGMPRSAISQYASSVTFRAESVAEAIISRRQFGYTLNERIYAHGLTSVKMAAREVERGLMLQESARDIAKRVRGLYDPSVRGGPSYAAMRLGRTEINNAHHATTVRLNQDKPWVHGFRWNLSGSHPRPDECDTLEGVHKNDKVPSKPHPQCLCYVTMLTDDSEKFVKDIADGKYDAYLKDDLGVRLR